MVAEFPVKTRTRNVIVTRAFPYLVKKHLFALLASRAQRLGPCLARGLLGPAWGLGGCLEAIFGASKAVLDPLKIEMAGMKRLLRLL